MMIIIFCSDIYFHTFNNNLNDEEILKSLVMCCNFFMIIMLQLFDDSVCTRNKQPPEVLCKKRYSQKFQKIYKKKPVPEPQACNLIKKETLTQLFFCEFYKISKNTFFTEHLWTSASKFVTEMLIFRSSRLQMFFKIGVLKNSAVGASS